jgi:hypothetical protein
MGNWRGLINSTNYILWPGSIRDLLLNGLTMDDIDFLSDKIYVANTIQSKNPLYKLNSRPEASDLRDCDKYLRYIKERQEIIRERN